MLQDNALYVTCEETCSKTTADEWVEVAELQSTQEEADTRLLLYALHATVTSQDGWVGPPAGSGTNHSNTTSRTQRLFRQPKRRPCKYPGRDHHT